MDQDMSRRASRLPTRIVERLRELYEGDTPFEIQTKTPPPGVAPMNKSCPGGRPRL